MNDLDALTLAFEEDGDLLKRLGQDCAQRKPIQITVGDSVFSAEVHSFTVTRCDEGGAVLEVAFERVLQ